MQQGQIEHVRRFNRTVTRRIGVLNDSYLASGRSLGEARLLYEIGSEGEELKTLRERLGLDSGYLSRLLRALEKDRLISVAISEIDGRGRRVSLSAKGKRKVASFDRSSDELANGLLAPLTMNQRERLIAAMDDVERLLSAAAIEIGVENPRSADAAWCFSQYFEELDRRFERGFDPGETSAIDRKELTAPSGALLIARLDGKAVGCGAVKKTEDKAGEIKRVWIAPAARGLGVGRRMIDALDDEARRLGIKLLRLDTNKALTEAKALYRSAGYREIKAFNAEPYAHHWFEKKLS